MHCPATVWPEAQAATTGPGPVLPCHGARSWLQRDLGNTTTAKENERSAEVTWKGEMKKREGKNKRKKRGRVENGGSKGNKETGQGDGRK